MYMIYVLVYIEVKTKVINNKNVYDLSLYIEINIEG